MNDFSKYWNALNYAFEKYNKLKRKISGLPYIVHPIRITLLLRAVGFSEFKNGELMIAALLHDLIEDTEIGYDDIKNVFGEKISKIVQELSKPKDIRKEEWLSDFNNASYEAKIIKMADRIDNLKDMEGWPLEKRISYAKQANIILETCGNVNSDLSSVLKNEIEKNLNFKI